MSEPVTSMIEVIVKLSPAASKPGAREVSAAIENCAAARGIRVLPLHPSTTDPELALYLVTQVNPALLNNVIRDLLRCDGVEGAYAKPSGEPPERNM